MAYSCFHAIQAWTSVIFHLQGFLRTSVEEYRRGLRLLSLFFNHYSSIMEQETKKCPYCGEEILAVAIKCKHCGEWLNGDREERLPLNDSTSDEVQTKNEQDTMNAQSYPDSDINIPLWANIFFWVALIGSFVGSVLELEQKSTLWISDWIISPLFFIGVAGLFYLLIKLTKRLGKPIGIIGIMMVLGCLACFIILLYVESIYWIGFYVCLVGVASILIRKYHNSLKMLGIFFVAYFIAFFVIYAILIVFYSFSTEYEAFLFFAFDVFFLYTFKECLIEVDKDPDASSTSPLILIGIGIVAPFIFGNLFGKCESNSDILEDNSVTTEQVIDDFSDDDYDPVVEESIDDELEDGSEGYKEDDSEGYIEKVSSHRIGVINDPDGYTNVRSEPSTSSDIVTKIFEGEEFSYEPFNDKWVRVYDDDGDFIGFMAASRVTPIR